MAFVPNTIVKLLSVNFENDYKNVVYWDSLSSQYNEMNNCVVKTFTNFTYQRRDNIIRVPAHIDTLYNCNYVMYQNNNYSSKWFYAFITNMEYVNDNCTHITIETDVWGTWWNEINIKPSFVEREHSNDDRVGANTFPENLETGEYIVNGNGVKEDTSLVGETNMWIIMAVSEKPNENDVIESVNGLFYGGVYSGLRYLPMSTSQNVDSMLNKFDKGKGEAVQSIFMAPTRLIKFTNNDYTTIGESKTAEEWDITLSSTPTTVDGYSPRNKKLLCYPYSFLIVTNNQGGSAIYHNEKFYKDGLRKFRTFGVLCPGCSIRTVPVNYNNIEFNHDEGLNLGKYPICNWTSDVYTNWLTQNSVNVVGSGLIGGLNTVVGLATADYGTAINGVSQVVNVIGETYKHQVMPDQAKGNVNCGDVAFANKSNTFRYIDMSIKAEYARIIDDFFDKYGYKVNRVKIPNMNHRKTWWFTKTIAVNIDGAIPQNDLTRIKKMFDDGVTFWKVHSQVEHYEFDNTL